MLFPYAEVIAYRAVHGIDPPPRWWWWRRVLAAIRCRRAVDWRRFDDIRVRWEHERSHT